MNKQHIPEEIRRAAKANIPPNQVEDNKRGIVMRLGLNLGHRVLALTSIAVARAGAKPGA